MSQVRASRRSGSPDDAGRAGSLTSDRPGAVRKPARSSGDLRLRRRCGGRPAGQNSSSPGHRRRLHSGDARSDHWAGLLTLPEPVVGRLCRGAHWQGAYYCPGPPRSAHPGVGGEHHGALVIRVSEQAADGKATAATLASVAAAFGVGRGSVTLVAGSRSRVKILDVAGADPRMLERLLAQ